MSQLSRLLDNLEILFTQISREALNLAEEPPLEDPVEDTPQEEIALDEDIQPSTFPINVDSKDEQEQGVQMIREVIVLVPEHVLNSLVEAGFKSVDLLRMYKDHQPLEGVLKAGEYNTETNTIRISFDHALIVCLPWATLHLLGQAVFDLLVDEDTKTGVAKQHGIAYSELNPFEQQDDPGTELGTKVYFSQAFAMSVINRDTAEQVYGPEMMRLVDEILVAVEDPSPIEDPTPQEGDVVDETA